jgi:S1-C subfamily serine protease
MTSGMKSLRLLIGSAAGLALTLVRTVAGNAPDAPASKELTAPPVVMEAYKVDASYLPKLSFGLSLDVWKDNNTQKVISIVVGAVKPDSEAERKGLTPRAKIYRVDGLDVRDLEASFRKGTELNRLFVNRLDGATVTLVYVVPGDPAEKTAVLTEHRSSGNLLPSRFDR